MKQTKIDQISAHLAKGRSLTQAKCTALFGYTRLAAAINDLRSEHGRKIETVLIPNGRSKYARYRDLKVFRVGDVVKAVNDSIFNTYSCGYEGKVIEVKRDKRVMVVRIYYPLVAGGRTVWASFSSWERI